MKKTMHKNSLLVSIILFFILFLCSFQAEPVNVSGSWKMEVTADAGTGEPMFFLKQAQDSIITGRYEGMFGEAEVKGWVKDEKVEFQFSIADNVVKYMGSVSGNSMKGKVILGPYGEGTFTGKKIGN